jgi:hypothetical protein
MFESMKGSHQAGFALLFMDFAAVGLSKYEDLSSGSGNEFIGGGYSSAGTCLFGIGGIERNNKRVSFLLPDSKRVDVNSFDIELAVTAGIIGARAGFSFGQLADFLLGWFGADIAEDDLATEIRNRINSNHTTAELYKMTWDKFYLSPVKYGDGRTEYIIYPATSSVFKSEGWQDKISAAGLEEFIEILELMDECDFNISSGFALPDDSARYDMPQSEIDYIKIKLAEKGKSVNIVK